MFQSWPGAHNEQVEANSFSSIGEGRIKEMGLLFPSSVSQRSSTFSWKHIQFLVKLSLVFERPLCKNDPISGHISHLSVPTCRHFASKDYVRSGVSSLNFSLPCHSATLIYLFIDYRPDWEKRQSLIPQKQMYANVSKKVTRLPFNDWLLTDNNLLSPLAWGATSPVHITEDSATPDLKHCDPHAI